MHALHPNKHVHGVSWHRDKPSSGSKFGSSRHPDDNRTDRSQEVKQQVVQIDLNEELNVDYRHAVILLVLSDVDLVD